MSNPESLSVSKNSFYNLIGTVVYCLCQWVTSALLVVHLSPDSIAISNTGVLQLAISVTNIFYAISTYNMRTYQISDTKNKYSYGDYVGTRVVTAIIATILCFGYITIGRVVNVFVSEQIVIGFFPIYSWNTIACIMFYMLFKLNETFSDVLHGIDQKNYRMDYVGISCVIRGLFSAIVFAFVIVTTGNILLSVMAMAIASLLIVCLYDVKCTKQFGSIKPIINKKTVTTLLVSCLPAVISSASFTSITSIPRQSLEAIQGEEALGFYGTIATPLVVVQVMATSIFNPMLTQLAEYYNDGETKKFVVRLLKNLALLVGISSIAYGAVALLGNFAVEFVFGSEFVPYTYLMYGIIGCTTMYVVSWLCTNTLIIMRRLKVCMVASLISLVVSVSLARSFIGIFGMNGVSFTIMVAYAIHITLCFIVIFKNLKEIKE